MKKLTSISLWLLLITLGLAATLFTSCSKDDETTTATTTETGSTNSTGSNTAVTGISLDKTTSNLTVGGIDTLTATVSPSTATDKTVTWTSSDATKATVVNGIITGVAAGTATITAKAGDKTVTCTITVASSIPLYVLINGVKWATQNVATPGTFATSPEASGMFYQWNSKLGWPATGAMSSITASNGTNTWSSTWNGGFINPSASNIWAKTNDPSPTGYRVPTFAEIQSLVDATKVTAVWTTQNNVYGEKFTDKTNGNSIFLPAFGFRDSVIGTLSYAGSLGCYWSSTAFYAYNAYGLYLNSKATYWGTYDRANGKSVRPVAE